MTERDMILDEASKRIAEAQRQRDKARRELSRAKSIIREMLRAFTADLEAEEDADSYKSRIFRRADRFTGGGK